ncbi:anthranilate synthase component I family protein [Staphylococcus simiae]|uniref:chorismate-binding protein n=1 Tax=Staphylococcus simiae TaxID=308354 RepID=UPI001A9889EC|nr:anthranilate synthase component I family protein [Staphylococcus simiae]MBO1198802.1 anthranilate synthase component I family protein [Staphylococcus simiae]MBO1200749.1 anthranilate synthase component I family protein [Staphylococcus simiae]MBO1203262.1 anthranilate synthase component I family protein [Staphylococcus simiae]MBO1210567.1 anthranilate synthase component I family protein [Staphylococcus simiae]MBO1229085.1 anthranilate synthase component I family protein [Staphylococcus simia
MTIIFNYRYYINEDDYETYHLTCHEYVNKCVAQSLASVAEVVNFAEQQQRLGRYVAMYLSYEAAQHFNANMATYNLQQDEVYAVAYSFDKVEWQPSDNSHKVIRKPKHQFAFETSQLTMMNNIKQIQQAIVEGNTYQVNYTTRLVDRIIYPISELYYNLTQESNGNYTVLMDTDEVKVASISPELFFQKGDFKSQSNMIVSKPMKGTMPRGKTAQEDEKNYKTLANSTKDQAENVMIVDLLRNDISRIAKQGTIAVYKLFFIEQYKTVFQMTSMVCGQLSNNQQLHHILTALFPCGSITGAPKLNTMKYIRSLETSVRSIYCGTIGLLLPTRDARMIFNIPIRTIEYRNNQAIYGVGAGITINSVAEDEVQEFYDKTKLLEML